MKVDDYLEKDLHYGECIQRISAVFLKVIIYLTGIIVLVFWITVVLKVRISPFDRSAIVQWAVYIILTGMLLARNESIRLNKIKMSINRIISFKKNPHLSDESSKVLNEVGRKVV